MDKFTEAFFTALFWSSTTEHGEPMDQKYGVQHLDDTIRHVLESECERFQRENAALLAGLDSSQCGHDFALTRNHHGAGFWDRGLGPIGDALTTASHAYGQVDLYVGDDDKVYC